MKLDITFQNSEAHCLKCCSGHLISHCEEMMCECNYTLKSENIFLVKIFCPCRFVQIHVAKKPQLILNSKISWVITAAWTKISSHFIVLSSSLFHYILKFLGSCYTHAILFRPLTLAPSTVRSDGWSCVSGIRSSCFRCIPLHMSPLLIFKGGL